MKIDLMIIGSQKAGTSALNNYLGEHPDISTHSSREMSFFKFYDVFKKGFKSYLNEHYTYNNEKVIIGKNVGIFEDEENIRRLKEYNPDMKIVVMLRNPVSRAFSAYKYCIRCSYEPLSDFKLALDAEEKRLEEDTFKWRNVAYKFKGHYHEHLNLLFKYFDKSQIKIIIYEEFKENPLTYIKNIEEWLEVDYFEPNIAKRHNSAKLPKFKFLTHLQYNDNIIKSTLKRLIPKSVRKKMLKDINKYNLKDATNIDMDKEIEDDLYNYFKEHNKKLEALINKDLSLWNR